MMAVTTQSTGADQVWAGSGKAFGGITGDGVNVAVIDSGVARHPALNNPTAATPNNATITATPRKIRDFILSPCSCDRAAAAEARAIGR